MAANNTTRLNHLSHRPSHAFQEDVEEQAKLANSVVIGDELENCCNDERKHEPPSDGYFAVAVDAYGYTVDNDYHASLLKQIEEYQPDPATQHELEKQKARTVLEIDEKYVNSNINATYRFPRMHNRNKASVISSSLQRLQSARQTKLADAIETVSLNSTNSRSSSSSCEDSLSSLNASITIDINSQKIVARGTNPITNTHSCSSSRNISNSSTMVLAQNLLEQVQQRHAPSSNNIRLSPPNKREPNEFAPPVYIASQTPMKNTALKPVNRSRNLHMTSVIHPIFTKQPQQLWQLKLPKLQNISPPRKYPLQQTQQQQEQSPVVRRRNNSSQKKGSPSAAAAAAAAADPQKYNLDYYYKQSSNKPPIDKSKISPSISPIKRSINRQPSFKRSVSTNKKRLPLDALQANYLKTEGDEDFCAGSFTLQDSQEQFERSFNTQTIERTRSKQNSGYQRQKDPLGTIDTAMKVRQSSLEQSIDKASIHTRQFGSGIAKKQKPLMIANVNFYQDTSNQVRIKPKAIADSYMHFDALFDTNVQQNGANYRRRRDFAEQDLFDCFQAASKSSTLKRDTLGVSESRKLRQQQQQQQLYQGNLKEEAMNVTSAQSRQYYDSMTSNSVSQSHRFDNLVARTRISQQSPQMQLNVSANSHCRKMPLRP